MNALPLLAGCPGGATEHALALFGIERRDLDRLELFGLVTMRLRTFAKPDIQVAWFHITDAGKKVARPCHA
jgi:hypothetical protein